MHPAAPVAKGSMPFIQLWRVLVGRGYGYSLVVELSLSMCEALGSIPALQKKYIC